MLLHIGFFLKFIVERFKENSFMLRVVLDEIIFSLLSTTNKYQMDTRLVPT